MTFPQVDAFRGSADTIRVVGHRGARGILPENSMIGFEFALSVGANLLEFDVVLSADNVPVITHNHCLHTATFRTADGRFLTGEAPKISSLTVAEIMRFDIGRIDSRSAYGQRFPDQAQLDDIRVPRLSELLQLVSRPENADAHLMLEIKSDPDHRTDVDHRRKLVKAVVGEVRAHGVSDRTIMHSFDWDLLAEFQHYAPDLPTSYLTHLPENKAEVGEDSSMSISRDFQGQLDRIPDLISEAGGELWCPYVDDVSADGIARAKGRGLCVAVWTVNEVADIDRMINLQVDAIVTDYPGRVQQRLSVHGMRWSDIGP